MKKLREKFKSKTCNFKILILSVQAAREARTRSLLANDWQGSLFPMKRLIQIANIDDGVPLS